MKNVLLTAGLLSLLCIACSRGENYKSAEVEIENVNKASSVTDKISAATAPGAAETAMVPASTPAIDQKLIKEGDLTLEVKDQSGYSKFFRETIKKYGAYIAKEENATNDEHNQTDILIRVPVNILTHC